MSTAVLVVIPYMI